MYLLSSADHALITKGLYTLKFSNQEELLRISEMEQAYMYICIYTQRVLKVFNFTGSNQPHIHCLC